MWLPIERELVSFAYGWHKIKANVEACRAGAASGAPAALKKLADAESNLAKYENGFIRNIYVNPLAKREVSLKTFHKKLKAGVADQATRFYVPMVLSLRTPPTLKTTGNPAKHIRCILEKTGLMPRPQGVEHDHCQALQELMAVYRDDQGAADDDMGSDDDHDDGNHVPIVDDHVPGRGVHFRDFASLVPYADSDKEDADKERLDLPLGWKSVMGEDVPSGTEEMRARK